MGNGDWELEIRLEMGISNSKGLCGGNVRKGARLARKASSIGGSIYGDVSVTAEYTVRLGSRLFATPCCCNMENFLEATL